jgi:hypothetical protein
MSNEGVAVTVFNPSTSPLQISVNDGAPFSIAGTSPNQDWVPQQPNPNPLSYTDGDPAPDVFGPGGNQVQVLADGVPISWQLRINIPKSAQVISLQLYIFFSDRASVSWTLLNNGQYIASGTGVSAASSVQERPRQ